MKIKYTIRENSRLIKRGNLRVGDKILCIKDLISSSDRCIRACVGKEYIVKGVALKLDRETKFYFSFLNESGFIHYIPYIGNEWFIKVN